MTRIDIAWLQPANQRRAAAVSGVLLLVLLAWILARIFWLLAAPAGDRSGAENTGGRAPASPAVEQVELDRYHLFGRHAANAVVAAWHDAPETALNLQLRGIVSSPDPESGFAIIVAGGRQAVYGIRQEVPGGAEVRGVYPDRVVLFHAGRYETLRLPVARAGSEPAAETPVKNAPAEPRLPSAVSLASLQDGLSFNLDSAAQYSLIPVRGGGYRLFLGRGAAQIANLGLRNGDVIRSANGIPLNHQQDVEQVIAKVLSGETLNLLIQRDGAELSLTPDIEKFVSGVR
jgi:general secretion pathway protein C